MAFIALTDAEISPDKPVSNDLLQKVKDNFDDHEARIQAGGGGGGGAGTIGAILNGSFETDSDQDGIPDNFTRSYYPGGSGAIDPADYVHGKQSYKFIHPGGGGNGGGYLETDYISISQLYIPSVPFSYKCSAAGVKVQVVARYFAADGSGDPGTYLGEQLLFENINNPTKWYLVELVNMPYPFQTARYIKYRFIGGHYDTNVAASIWFDGLGADQGRTRTRVAESINQAQFYFSSSQWYDYGLTWNFTIPASNTFRWFAVMAELFSTEGDFQTYATGQFRTHIFQVTGQPFNIYGSTSASIISPSAWYPGVYSYADISSLAAGPYALRLQGRVTIPAAGGGMQLRSQNPLLNYFGVGKLEVDAFNGITTETYG